MNENGAGVRPETIALDILIKQTIEQGHRCSASRLFTDTKVASFPAMVIHDSVLEPVDKLVWMAIRLQVYEGNGDDIFPTFNSLAKTVNVSSRSTVSRAINILRLTRWLTLYSNHTRDSDARKGFQSNIYILHDDSMPLIDTIYLEFQVESEYLRNFNGVLKL